jgi:hypothetical protein
LPFRYAGAIAWPEAGKAGTRLVCAETASPAIGIGAAGRGWEALLAALDLRSLALLFLFLFRERVRNQGASDGGDGGTKSADDCTA